LKSFQVLVVGFSRRRERLEGDGFEIAPIVDGDVPAQTPLASGSSGVLRVAWLLVLPPLALLLSFLSVGRGRSRFGFGFCGFGFGCGFGSSLLPFACYSPPVASVCLLLVT